jgi:mono/diheme cytochrome c family protein
MAGHHSDGDLAWKIGNGRGAMPAWKGVLTEREIWHLVNYIKNLPAGKKAKTAHEHRH